VAQPLDAARRLSGIAIEDETATARFVEAWLRRQGLMAVPVPRTLRYEPIHISDRIVIGDMLIDLARHSVEISGADVRLTPTEYRLLLHLARHPERLAEHRDILLDVWGSGYEDDIHLLQVTIRSLRARIALVTDKPLIETVYGVGYRIARPAVEDPEPPGRPLDLSLTR
jgi:DNA-binding response OmpR family regulator